MNILSLIAVCFLSLVFSDQTLAQYTPGGFFSLARAGDIEGLKILLSEKPSEFLLNSSLEAAVIGQQEEAIKLLHEHGADLNYINPQGTNILVNAIMLKSFNSAQVLLELGADPDTAGYHRLYHGYTMNWHWTPLMAASYQGSLDTVEVLLKKNADVKKQGYSVSKEELETATDIAAYSGHLDILKSLLKHDGTLSDDAILKAVRGGHLEVVKYLLKKGADINAVYGTRRKTLLMEAAWWGHLDLVVLLLKKGSNINAADSNGYTALSDAAANGGNEFPHQLDIVKTLVKNGADVRQAGEFKLTPLMRAQNANVIEFLVEAGAR